MVSLEKIHPNAAIIVVATSTNAALRSELNIITHKKDPTKDSLGVHISLILMRDC
jgi:hypothetical protein